LHLYRTSLGDLVNGSFPIPDNPILLSTAQKTGLRGLSDLVNAAFPIPQNPIMAPTSMDRPKVLTPPVTSNALVRSLTAAHTGPVATQKGMGDAASTLQSIGGVLDNTVSIGGTDVPYWIFAIGGLALFMYLSGGKKGPSRYQTLRATHS
jgi:hypothetical protein